MIFFHLMIQQLFIKNGHGPPRPGAYRIVGDGMAGVDSKQNIGPKRYETC